MSIINNKYKKEEVDYLKEELKQINLSKLNMDENLMLDLITAFEKSILDLRQNVEDNKPLLLQQIYGELYGNRTHYPVKIIVEITPDIYLSKSVTFEKNTKLSVKEIYFSFLEEVTIWPITIISTSIIEAYNLEFNNNINTSHVVKVIIKPLNIPLRTMKIESLRFFVEGLEAEQFITNLFTDNNILNVFYKDSEERNESNKTKIQQCIIEYTIPNINKDIGIFRDFGNLQQIYHFFTIKNFNLNNIFENLVIYIPINFYRNIPNICLKLFNFLAINQFETTTHPLTINFQQTEQKLIINPYNTSLKAHKIQDIILLSNKEKLYNWHSYDLNGDKYISFLKCKEDIKDLNGKKVYCNVIVHNGENANIIKQSDNVNIIEYGNFSAFINYLDNYTKEIMNENNLQTYLNTDFKMLLNDLEEFKKHINNIIRLTMPNHMLFIQNINMEKKVEIEQWERIPIPIPTKIISLSITTNRDNVFLFLNILLKFINQLSSVKENIVLKTLWKGKQYVVR